MFAVLAFDPITILAKFPGPCPSFLWPSRSLSTWRLFPGPCPSFLWPSRSISTWRLPYFSTHPPYLRRGVSPNILIGAWVGERIKKVLWCLIRVRFWFGKKKDLWSYDRSGQLYRFGLMDYTVWSIIQGLIIQVYHHAFVIFRITWGSPNTLILCLFPFHIPALLFIFVSVHNLSS